MSAPTPMQPTTGTREPIKVVGDILIAEMDLPAGRLMQENQRYLITAAQDGLQVTLSYGPSKTIAAGSDLDDSDPPNEIQEATVLHQVQVKLESFNDSARIRQHEVALALRSIFSQQAQSAAGIQIARNVGPFNDASFPEETGMMTTFIGTIAVTALHRKVKAAAIFEPASFHAELRTDVAPDAPVDVSPKNPYATQES